jgi:hypothetical protein
MIKFFRNIRRKLLQEGKTANYLKYAIGEIVLVVIGILIALQVNNWNEMRKDQTKEIIYLQRLETEMAVILDRLHTGVDIAQQSIEATKFLLTIRKDSKYHGSGDLSNDDEVRQAIRNLRAGRVPSGSPTVFKEMVSSGELTLLRNENLRNALFKYDEFAVISRDIWRSGWDEFLEGYKNVMSVVEADVNFDRPISETYTIEAIDYNKFYGDNDLKTALNIILAAKANHYEVLSMQLDLAMEIDSILKTDIRLKNMKPII